jgi:hypothetical protein
MDVHRNARTLVGSRSPKDGEKQELTMRRLYYDEFSSALVRIAVRKFQAARPFGVNKVKWVPDERCQRQASVQRQAASAHIAASSSLAILNTGRIQTRILLCR